MNQSSEPSKPARKLVHEIRNDVAVIAACLSGMKRARNDDERFDQLLTTADTQGIQPLLKRLDQLVAIMRARDDESQSD